MSRLLFFILSYFPLFFPFFSCLITLPTFFLLDELIARYPLYFDTCVKCPWILNALSLLYVFYEPAFSHKKLSQDK